MTLLDELIMYIVSKDRLELLRFRQRVVKKYGRDKFLELVGKANEELDNENSRLV